MLNTAGCLQHPSTRAVRFAAEPETVAAEREEMPKRTGQGDEWDYGAIIAILTAIIVVLGAATFMLHRDSRLNASGARLLRRNRVRGEKEAQFGMRILCCEV